jgi:alpha-amylase/alpha-mannosidase (GH57 family)
MSKVYLAFLWHQHQPIYKNPLTEYYELPWVRLHATKDYYDMVAILDNYPNVKVNINLVPSLLVQLEEYASGKAKDKFLDLTLKPAENLTTEDKFFILKNFFMANFENMIRPYPRYLQIYDKREKDANDDEIKFKVQSFSIEEIRDLQVWFNLAWFDPYWKNNDEFIKYMYSKGTNFTEEEKTKLVEMQLKVCGMVIDKHKEAQDRGQIEVTTTPFYHPILPLLCDTNSAYQAVPNMILPSNRFSHPEDAKWHISNAISYYEKLFGKKPFGMWPSEGSVSNSAVEIISDAGIKWVATDEAIMFNGIKDISGERKNLFRPFNLNVNGKYLKAVFRDHGLSDSIGFVYYKWKPEDAVGDFIQKIKDIGNYARQNYDYPLVSIILDGENCWEYYSNDGWDFLSMLYEKLNNDPNIETVRINDYLEKFPPKNTITDLKAGSWINGNFGIWIGHNEDNASWDYLGMTRNFLTEFIEKNPQVKGTQNEKSAWQNIYAAEGSDWNWWYGDDNSSDNDTVFDFIYRQHLIKVYECMGQRAPDILYKPIKNSTRKENLQINIPPKTFISPNITEGNFEEWKNGGYYEASALGGSMRQVSTIFRSLNYGFDSHNFYFKFNLNDSVKELSLSEHVFFLTIFQPAEIKILIKLDDENKITRFWGEQNGWIKDFNAVNSCFKTSLNFLIPFSELNLPNDYESIECIIGIEKNNSDIERYPRNGRIIIPSPNKFKS